MAARADQYKQYWSIVDLQCHLQCFRHTGKSISYTHTYIHSFLDSFPTIGHYRALNRVPCAIQYILTGYLFYICLLFCSVVSNSLQPHGLQPTRLLSLWDSPGKNSGVGCHFLLQGIFPTQGSNPALLHYRQILYPSVTWETLHFMHSSGYICQSQLSNLPLLSFFPLVAGHLFFYICDSICVV